MNIRLVAIIQTGHILPMPDSSRPMVGLWEDAATATAAGPFAAYLASESRLVNKEIAIEQGTKMGRRSILQVSK